MEAVLCEMHRKVMVPYGAVAWVRVFQTQKSLGRDSKEIKKPAVFAQPITLLELARSKTDRTILRETYERTDENEYDNAIKNQDHKAQPRRYHK